MNTGYHRKYAIRLLNGPPPGKAVRGAGRTRRRGVSYSREMQNALKTKLKTANEISAAEAVKSFHAAWVLDATGQYCLIPESFPQDIGAKNFMESLTLYRRLRSKQRAEPAEISQTLTVKDLDELFPRAPRQRKIVDVIWRNKNREMSLDEIALEIGGVNQSTNPEFPFWPVGD